MDTDTQQNLPPTKNKQALFDKPRNVKILMYSFYVLSVLLVGVDVFIHRHALNLADGNLIKTIEQLPSFYAVYGFVGCSLLVFGAKLMRLLVMRSENYYDERSDEPFYHTQVNAETTSHNENPLGDEK